MTAVTSRVDKIMGAIDIFWAAAGVLAGIALSFLIVPLWRACLPSRSRRLWTVAVAAIFCVTAFVVYGLHGNPRSLGSPAAKAPQSADHAQGSIAAVTATLAARLADQGGSDADWQLLQQSYEFLGDSAAAALAAQHRLKPGDASERSDSGAALDAYRRRVEDHPSDASAWLALAELQRKRRDFAAAGAAYEHVAKLKELNADEWADYADVQASQHNTLDDAGVRAAIDAALKLDARHAKALWLKASLLLEQKHYAQALQAWERLRGTLPDASPDIAVVDANIAEARRLVGNVSASKLPAAETSAGVHGTVSLAPALKSRVSKDMTLFVYAKAIDSPGPPVAVLRTAVNAWPAVFELTDAQAMLPSRRLSQFDQVVVEARLSSTGQALPQPGDLRTAAVVTPAHSPTAIALTLANVVSP